jgi:hypothetical protein
MATTFDASEPSTALRLYLILACCAARGETVTYDDLAQRACSVGKQLLNSPLDAVAAWCQENELPALTSLVVESMTGSPAPGFKAVPKERVMAEQDKVRAYDWYSIFPPTIEELTQTR